MSLLENIAALWQPVAFDCSQAHFCISWQWAPCSPLCVCRSSGNGMHKSSPAKKRARELATPMRSQREE